MIRNLSLERCFLRYLRQNPKDLQLLVVFSACSIHFKLLSIQIRVVSHSGSVRARVNHITSIVTPFEFRTNHTLVLKNKNLISPLLFSSLWIRTGLGQTTGHCKSSWTSISQNFSQLTERGPWCTTRGYQSSVKSAVKLAIQLQSDPTQKKIGKTTW